MKYVAEFVFFQITDVTDLHRIKITDVSVISAAFGFKPAASLSRYSCTTARKLKWDWSRDLKDDPVCCLQADRVKIDL